MDVDGLPIIGPGIDYTKVEPIQQKRTLAFINHFLTHTVSFLNQFSTVCESKLVDMDRRLQKLEASMCILEAKLVSINSLQDTKDTAKKEQHEDIPQLKIPQTSTPLPEATQDSTLPPVDSDPEPTLTKISEDSHYAKYFKMLLVGVPEMAVKMKMQQEGIDPSLLDNPNAPAPPNEDSVGGSPISSD